MTYEEYENLRNETGLKNADVARLANIPPSTFTDWKKGKSKPKEEKLSKILSALNVDKQDKKEKIVADKKDLNLNVSGLFSGPGAYILQDWIDKTYSTIPVDCEVSDYEMKKAMEIASRYLYATDKERKIVDQLLEIDKEE